MARFGTYLYFHRNTEEAFNFYKSVFATEFSSPIQRYGAAPSQPGMPAFPEEDKNMVMHVELPTLAGHVLMGSDAIESRNFHLVQGNNFSLSLEPDSLEETQRLFSDLGEGGKVDMPLQDTFWGATYGSLTDKFGIQWMFNFYKDRKPG